MTGFGTAEAVAPNPDARHFLELGEQSDDIALWVCTSTTPESPPEM